MSLFHKYSSLDNFHPFYSLIIDERKLSWINEEIPLYLLEIYRNEKLLLKTLNSIEEKKRLKLSASIKHFYKEKREVLENIINLQIVNFNLSLEQIAKRVAYRKTVDLDGPISDFPLIKTKHLLLLRAVLSHIFSNRYEEVKRDLLLIKENFNKEIVDKYYECDQKRFLDKKYIIRNIFKNEEYFFATNDNIYGEFLEFLLKNEDMMPLPVKNVPDLELVSNYNSEIKISLKNSTIDYRRTQIPAGIRAELWRKFFEEETKKCSLYGVCFFCNCSINYENWHACHIISHKNGGSGQINNLLPGCASCNISMNKKNVNDYILEMGIFSSKAAEYLGIRPPI